MISLLSRELAYAHEILSVSRSSDDERRVEVAIDYQVGQGIILANLVFSCIYLPCEQLVEVHILARRSFSPHLLNIQLLLQVIREAHYHI